MTNYKMLSPEQYMQMAITLARRGLGRTWPNPSVGCVIVKNGAIIARGRTANGGRPHAESLALEMAGVAAEGSTIYVTLEPCTHHGKTPPCSENIIRHRPNKVVIGCLDSDPRVAGKGAAFLEEAGIQVVVGLLQNECRNLNKGFFKRIEKGLPHVMLKAATSADGRYLPGNGAPIWVTGEVARNHAQLIRSQYDAIVTGTGTVLADDPSLNCRLPGMEEYSPVKVVIGNTPIPKTAKVFAGKEVWHYERGDLKTILKALAERGITRVMVEAGPRLSNAFLKDNLVDEVVVFKSTQAIGDQGRDFFAPKELKDFVKFKECEIGEDLKLTYESMF